MKEIGEPGRLCPPSCRFRPGPGRIAAICCFVTAGICNSTDVLARLVEVVSGMPIDRFLETRIFAPLGMKDTGFGLPEKRSIVWLSHLRTIQSLAIRSTLLR